MYSAPISIPRDRVWTSYSSTFTRGSVPWAHATEIKQIHARYRTPTSYRSPRSGKLSYCHVRSQQFARGDSVLRPHHARLGIVGQYAKAGRKGAVALRALLLGL